VKRLLCIGASVCAIVLVVSLSTAAADLVPVAIDNSSFELPGTAKIKGWNGETGVDIPGWASDSQAIDSGVESDWPGHTDGIWSGFLMNTDPSVWNTTAHIIAAGEQFKLRLDARDNWTDGGSGILKMDVYYLNGAARVSLASATYTLTTSWSEYALYVPDASAGVGKLLGVELDNTYNSNLGSWIGLDKVQFVPEPSTFVLLIVGLGCMGFAVRRR
jgi:hypothetical protein